MPKVLLSDAQQRKTLAVTRSLGKRGLQIIAADRTRFTPTACSKYCYKHIVSPDPHSKEDEYLSWIKKTLLDNNCQIFIPMDDDAFFLAVKHRDELEKLCLMPLPASESYFCAADKGKAMVKAREAGLCCPLTMNITDLQQVYEFSEDMKYPLIIKPRISSGSRGIRKVSCKEELIAEYIKIHSQYPWPMIQQYIEPKNRYDVCLLYDRNGELKASFVQKEIRNFPINWGPSTVQESVENPELLDMSLKLMQLLPWQGIVEIEFMENKADGQMFFMEINPRFWASVQMAIFAGIDFPWLLYQTMINEPIEYVSSYRTGIKYKWTFPGEILHFLFNKQRRNMDPPFLSGKKQLVYDDMYSPDDPLPVLGFFLAAARYFFDKNMWQKILFR